MKKIILVVLLLTFKLSFAQTGWFWQNPKPQGMDIRSVTYVTANTIYAIGDGGAFLKTTNAGTNWTSKTILPVRDRIYNYARSIFAENENSVYALFDNYVIAGEDKFFIMKSTNGGNSWDSILVTGAQDVYLDEISFVNENTGYAYCNNNINARASAYKTTNAGLNWALFSIPAANDSISSIFFLNENTGWAGKHHDNKYYRTTNAGSSWSTYTYFESFNNPFFINENTGWISNGYMYKTTNGGINFTQISYFPQLSEYGFINQNFGWAIAGGSIYATSNSGVNWSISLNNNNSMVFNAVDFLNQNTGIAAGSFGIIYRTSDAGISWTPYNNNSVETGRVSDICMINENTGWALNNGKLIKSSDGGSSWIKVDSVSNYLSMKFLNANVGICAGENFFNETTNGGLTWKTNQYTNIGFVKVLMPSQNNWYIVGHDLSGSGRLILKTSSAGAAWDFIPAPQMLVNDLFFIDGNTGFFSGVPQFYKTTNGGVNWLQTSNQNCDALFFINANTGWIGWQNDIYKTTNGGSSWQQQFHNDTYQFSAIQFVNANTGWFISNHLTQGRILKTTDGGSSWFQNLNFLTENLSDISFINENTGWVSGLAGIILKTTTGGTIGVQQISTSLPDKFYLEQNYPNPFNPVTNIEFSLPQKSFVKLKVFDLLGREIANLVNENLSAGSYKYDFNASALTSGIYFYKLETENFSETKKMVVVK